MKRDCGRSRMDEFKTLIAKTLAYTVVFGPIVFLILLVGYIENGG